MAEPSRPRLGLLRGFIGVLFATLLLLPVGVETPTGPTTASVGESLVELARGRLGVGVLSALVEGGALATAALVRVLLVLLAAIAFWLTGRIEIVERRPVERRRCPHCGAWVARSMADCPACGKPVRA